ncbi:hypothetical protein [Cellulomonas sp.]|uniref:hypothetical protein n=1 Tax=Cellulomonas sp. TaxID=40001 RepID=UPI00258BBACA|nr:hypothetical protein [Cellulomonas sp.]MCR6690058.1 hypothetical protein [Cellulomonas sp.]
MWSPDLKLLTQYDEDLIKPAILFADKVDLRSDRLDMIAKTRSDALALRNMPMRTFYAYIGVSFRRDPDEIETLGIEPAILATAEELEPFIGESRPEIGELQAFWKAHSSQVQEVVTAIGETLRNRSLDLKSSELQKLSDTGLLTTSGWAVGGDDAWSLAWTDEADFFSRIIDDLIGSMASWGNAVLIEPGSRMFLSREATAPDDAPVISPERLAVELFGRLPGMRELPLDEIMEIRHDLSDYLAPFRAEIVLMSDELTNNANRDGSAISAEIDHAWHGRIRPILAELDSKVKRGKYPRQLLNAFSEDTSSVAATGASVLLAAGSMYAGVGALLPAVAAASLPFIRALNSRLKATDEVRDHRLYFLYEASRRISGTQR